MSAIVELILKSKRHTSIEWHDANPILYEGELGFESNTQQYKIGDGTTQWANLPYVSSETATYFRIPVVLGNTTIEGAVPVYDEQGHVIDHAQEVITPRDVGYIEAAGGGFFGDVYLDPTPQGGVTSVFFNPTLDGNKDSWDPTRVRDTFYFINNHGNADLRQLHLKKRTAQDALPGEEADQDNFQSLLVDGESRFVDSIFSVNNLYFASGHQSNEKYYKIDHNADGVLKNLHLTETLEVDGATTLKNDTEVRGIESITNITDSTAINNGALVVSGGVGIAKRLNVGKATRLEDTLDVWKNTIIGREEDPGYDPEDPSAESNHANLYIHGDQTIYRDNGSGGNLVVDWDTLIKHDLRLLNDAIIGKIIDHASEDPEHPEALTNLDIYSFTKFHEPYEALKKAVFKEDVDVEGILAIVNETDSDDQGNGALTVAGGAYITKNLNVNTNAIIQGDLNVKTDSVLEGKLEVQDVTSLLKAVTIGQNTAAGGADLQIYGNTTIGSSTQKKTLIVWGNVLFKDTANTTEMQHVISVTNATNSDAKNNGALVITGGVGIGKNLNVGGNTNITGTLGVTSNSTFTGIVDIINTTEESHDTSTNPEAIDAALKVAGGVHIGKKLHVVGYSILDNNTTIAGITKITNDQDITITASGNQRVYTNNTGALQITGGTYIGKKLFVNGDAIFNKDVYLKHDPLTDPEAATKKYVDDQIRLSGATVYKGTVGKVYNPDTGEYEKHEDADFMDVPTTGVYNGHRYDIICDGNYAGYTDVNPGSEYALAKGDVLICKTQSTTGNVPAIPENWSVIRAGDEGEVTLQYSMIEEDVNVTTSPKYDKLVLGEASVKQILHHPLPPDPNDPPKIWSDYTDIVFTGDATADAKLKQKLLSVETFLNYMHYHDFVRRRAMDDQDDPQTFYGDVEIGYKLKGGTGADRDQLTTTPSNLTVRGIVNITNTAESNTTNDGALRVTGGAGIGKNLNVGGNTNITGNTTIGKSGTASTLTVWGATTLSSILNVTGNTTIGKSGTASTLIVWGATTLKSTLGVTGSTTLSNTLDVTGNTTIGKSGTESTLTVWGATTLKGIVSITNTTDSTAINNGALVVSGGVGIGKNLNVGGNTNITGNTTIGKSGTASTLTVWGAATLNSTLNVAGNTTIGSASAANINTNTYGNVEINRETGYDATSENRHKFHVHIRPIFDERIEGTINRAESDHLGNQIIQTYAHSLVAEDKASDTELDDNPLAPPTKRTKHMRLYAQNGTTELSILIAPYARYAGYSDYVRTYLHNDSNEFTNFLTFVPNTTDTSVKKLIVESSIYTKSKSGTTSAPGYDTLYIGNATKSGSEGNRYGSLRIYSSGIGYHEIIGAATDNNIILTMPVESGTILTTGGSSQTINGDITINGWLKVLGHQDDDDKTLGIQIGTSSKHKTINAYSKTYIYDLLSITGVTTINNKLEFKSNSYAGNIIAKNNSDKKRYEIFSNSPSGDIADTIIRTYTSDSTYYDYQFSTDGYIKIPYGIYINSKKAVFTSSASDAWLRINDGGAFTGGTYFGETIVRTDDQFQVGDGGSYFKASTTGVVSSVITQITNTTQSTATNNGALVVSGGVGIGKNLNVGGNTEIGKSGTASTLIVWGVTTLKSNLSITGDTNFNEYAKYTNKNFYFKARTGTTSSPVAGSNLYFACSTLGTASNYWINDVGSARFNTLTVDSSISFAGDLDITSTTEESHNSSTGAISAALKVAGGVHISKKLHVVGNSSIGGTLEVLGAATLNSTLGVSGVTTITNTTESSSTSTGALKVSGGVGIAKNLYVGGNATLGDAATDSHTVNGNMTHNGIVYFANGTTYYINNSGTGNLNALTVNGATTLKSTLSITGATTLSSTLSVSGITTLKSKLQMAFNSNPGLIEAYNADKSKLHWKIFGASSDGSIPNSNMVSLYVYNKSGTDYMFNFKDTGYFRVYLGYEINDKVAMFTDSESDTWLRINSNKAFTSGVYFGSSLVRTDNQFQVGSNGANILLTTTAATFAVPVSITNTTDSSSVSTGALIVSGGVGIAKKLYVGGNADIAGTSQLTGNTIIGKSGTASTLTVWGATTLKSTLGVSGATTLSSTLEVAGITGIINATQSSSTSTGALVVSGGVGIGKNINVGGNASIGGTLSVTSTSTFTGAVTINSTTDSSSTATGALIVKGGVGIAKNLYVGGSQFNSGALAFVTNRYTGNIIAYNSSSKKRYEMWSNSNSGGVANAIMRVYTDDTGSNFYNYEFGTNGYFSVPRKLVINSKVALDGITDNSWLYINMDGASSKQWSSGVWFGTSIVRTDNQLQVGSNGANILLATTVATFSVPVNVGSASANKNLNVQGEVQIKSAHLQYNSTTESLDFVFD